jgi:hypothetical protein
VADGKVRLAMLAIPVSTVDDFLTVERRTIFWFQPTVPCMICFFSMHVDPQTKERSLKCLKLIARWK